MQLILATPAVLWGGWPVFERGWASFVSRRLNMFSVIALGTGVQRLEEPAGERWVLQDLIVT